MKTWNKTKKVMGLASLLSLAVVASVNFERSLYSDAFMIDQDVKVVSRRLDDSFARVVASEQKDEKISVKYFELTEENKARFNGQWEVMRGFEDINDEVNEFYNKFESRTSSIVKVEVEMVAGGVVVRGEEFENFFYISDITNAGTLSIVRKLGEKHYEVLETKRIVKAPELKLVQKPVESQEVKEVVRDYKKGVELSKDIDLVIERALVPELSKDVIVGDFLRGSLSLVGGNIESLSASVSSADGKERSIDLSYAEIKDGGQFQVDYMGEIVHGIITNNGQDAYRVRFATGPLQGAMLNFLSYEQLEIMQEREEEAKFKAEEAQALKEEQADEAAPMLETQPVVEQDVVENREDTVTLFEKSGFDFGQERKPASI